MKKVLALAVTLVIVGLFYSQTATAALPKGFEGIITYKISYPGSTIPKEQMAMMPSTVTVSIKGTKSRMELATGMGSQIVITDYAAKTRTTLLDMMGQKYAIKQNNDEIQKDMAKEPQGKVQVTGETKTIAGYACKKAVVTTDDDGVKTTFDVYYTEELGGMNQNFDSPVYKDINGVMLEFSEKQQSFSMQFTATGVEKKSVSDKDFEIPAGYTLTTQDELKAKFGGMGDDE